MSTDVVPTFLYYYTQILTSVELRNNQIGDDGAQYLADALKTNTVTIYYYLLISFNPFAIFL